METKKAELTLESIEQVADMLWLLNEIETIEVKESINNLTSTPETNTVKDDEKKVTTEPTITPNDTSPPKKKKVTSVYDNPIPSTKTDIKADPIRMPKKLALSNYRAWERSFKSFYHKVDSTREFVLDEAKTVDIIAKTRLVQPIFKAKKVKYFHLTMVIEQSPSMDIWKELILEFQQTIQRFGVFESINFYYLASRETSVHLYADRNLKREVDPKKLNLHPQTLLTVVSDCVSPAWHSHHIFKILERWSKSVPVSITQMFPKRMWQGTSLYQGFQTSFTSHSFKQLNKNLLSDDGYYDKDDITFNLPVINFQPESIKAWSSVIYGKREKWIDGIILEELKEQPFPKKNTNKKSISVEERVNRYLAQASPLAQELARYASVLPISFHVIRVLQALKLPKSSQIHLAEFFLGGLIKREVNKEQKVSFDFHEGVRDYFRNQLTATTAYRLQESMSSFVSQNLNSSLDFQALIDNPNSTSGLYLSKDEVAFVKLRADTLRKLGGDYGREAESLMENLALGKKGTLEHKLKSEFLENFMPLRELIGKEIEVYSRMFNYSFSLSARLARSFSKEHSRDIIKKLSNEISETYSDVGWIKKLENNRVLWGEGSIDNYEKIKIRFEKIGLQIDLVKSRDEALERIVNNTYLVVVLNIEHLKNEEESYALLDKFRELDKDTPFIFFSDLDVFKNKKMILERGGQGLTGDPIKLCRMVMNIIEDGIVIDYTVNSSVLLIKSKVNKSFGTGFCIFKDDGGSYILTTTVVLNSVTIEGIKIDDFEVSIYSIGSTKLTDLAILYVKDLFLTPLELETNNLLNREVYVIGYSPSKLEYNQNRVDGKIIGDKISIISREGVSYNLNLWKMIGSSGEIKKSYSGGPLLSKSSGKVIGLVSHKEGNEKRYAITIDYLKHRIDDTSILPFKNLNVINLETSSSFFHKGHMQNSIVMVSSKDINNSSFGTGFVIYQDEGGSYVLTTNNILESTKTPIVNDYEIVEIIESNKRLNLAILYVVNLYEKPFEFENEDMINRDVELLVYSSFIKYENKKETIEAKIVSNFLNIVDNENKYKGWKVVTYEDYDLNLGNLGAPLISKENGKLIGILNNKEGGDKGYAISIQHLQELILDKRLSALKMLPSFDLDVNNLYFNKGNMCESIVFIGSKDSSNKSFGTGFVVHQDEGGSYVVTADFVVKSAIEVIVNHQYNVEIIRLSEVFELAILYVRDFYEEPFLLQTEDFSSRDVEMMGYSSFRINQYKKEAIEGNIISDDLVIVDKKSQSYKAWEFSVNDEHKLERGMSGSPLILKETNNVIGVLIQRKGSSVGYAISIEHLKDVWDDE